MVSDERPNIQIYTHCWFIYIYIIFYRILWEGLGWEKKRLTHLTSIIERNI